MELDLVFLVTYSCPACQESLEARTSGLPAWLRCPRCGRASLPPEHERPSRSDETTRSATDPMLDALLTPGDGLPIRPRSMAPLPPPAVRSSSNIRLLIGIAFLMTLFLCVFSLLESNGVLAIIAGLASLICLILLLRPSGREPQD